MNLDIVCINESHLTNGQVIELDGYVWFGNNRTLIDTNAVRGSGGVGILVKQTLLQHFNVSVLDCTFEGILWLKLVHTANSDNVLLICSCYLPPEGSSRGDNAQAFYDSLLGQVYMYYLDNETLIICGDVNGRIGSKQDYDPNIDEIPPRNGIDTDEKCNKFGKYLLEFLNDSKLCVLNGRGNPAQDDFTSISNKGRAVVDYIIVPHRQLNKFARFAVHPMYKLMSVCKIQPEPRLKVLDHSLLTCSVTLMESPHSVDGHNNGDVNANKTRMKRRIYDVKSIPRNIFEDKSDEMDGIINTMMNDRANQENVDIIYSDILDLLHGEMDNKLEYRDVGANTSRKKRRNHKPFWNKELQQLWKLSNENEKHYVKYRGPRRERERLRTVFKDCRNNFDRIYSKTRRAYERQRRDTIDEMETNNPRQFWNEIKKLGPGNHNPTIDSVLLDDGRETKDTSEIMYKWRNDFQKLFGKQNGDFDEDFLTSVEDMHTRWENEHNDAGGDQYDMPDVDTLNVPITIDEIRKAIAKCKNGKAVGIDNIPNEILKLPQIHDLIHRLCDMCFEKNVVPTVWLKSIIHPILKKGRDARVPVSYRSISLMSTVAKLFNSVINTRLVTFLEDYNLLSDEQNGFRRSRSCLDHLYVLTSILRNRKRAGLSTYLAFVDFNRAFDTVNHSLLTYKMRTHGLYGKFYNIVATMHTKLQSTLRINNCLTDWFDILSGVRQGDNLAPTLFAFFVDNLAGDINRLDCGVQIGNEKCGILMYADDIILLTETPEHLQQSLDTLHDWTKHWRLIVNVGKTKTMHCRKPSEIVTNAIFTLGTERLDMCTNYRYLGFEITEHLDYGFSVNTLSNASSRAFGALVAKSRHLGGLGYATFTKLYSNCVVPVMDYAAGIWGIKRHNPPDIVQRKAMRYFLGTNKFTAIPALEGEMGWFPPHIRHKLDVTRLLWRLSRMSSERLTKRVFLWDLDQPHSWGSDVSRIVRSAGYHGDILVVPYNIVNMVREHLETNYTQQWLTDINSMPKLRTYRTLKFTFGVEDYVSRPMDKYFRSALARVRMGVFPIRIETGRWRGLPLHDRICVNCDLDEVETEEHFLCVCPRHDALRNELKHRIAAATTDLEDMNNDEFIKCILCTATIRTIIGHYIINLQQNRI